MTLSPASPEMTWVPPEILDDRLDPRPFQRSVQDPIVAVRSAGFQMVKLGAPSVTSYLNRGVGGAVDRPTACRLFKSRSVREGFLAADADYLPEGKANRLGKKRLVPGDVILTSSGLGTIGRAALFLSSELATVDNHVSIIRCRSAKLHGGYLVAFLNSRFGQAWCTWGTTGSTGQLELNRDRVAEFQIPLPARSIQTYIGVKLELAERCRSRSLALRSSAASALTADWGWSEKLSGWQNQPGTIAHMVEPRMFDDRLDPEFYRLGFLAVEEWLDAQECWHLSELVEPPVKGVQPSYDPDGTVPALTVTHVDPFVLDRSGATGFVTEDWLSQNGRARIEAGELLYTVTGPPLGETVVVEKFHLPAAVNSHVARVRLRPEFKFRHLLAAMLNSPLGQLQTTRYSKGIRQKELYPSDFIRFRFPKLSSEVCSRLEKKFAASCRLVEQARILVQEAKADVEALIEGTLDVDAILAGKLKAPTADDIPELAEDDA